MNKEIMDDKLAADDKALQDIADSMIEELDMDNYIVYHQCGEDGLCIVDGKEEALNDLAKKVNEIIHHINFG